MAKKKSTGEKAMTPNKKNTKQNLFVDKQNQDSEKPLIDIEKKVAKEKAKGILLLGDNVSDGFSGKQENENIKRTISKEENVTKFSFDEPIFLQIHAENIYNIFSTALLAPAVYNKNRAFSDVQTINPKVLVISNHVLGSRDENTTLLEIQLTEVERQQIKTVENIGIMPFSLPVSRVKCVYVNSEKTKRDVVTTALNNDGGFIPNDLVISKFPIEIKDNFFPDVPIYTNELEQSSSIKLYNSILGVFAFLKNYSFLLADRTNSISTIPDHFFYAIQALNNDPVFQIVKNERTTIFYRQLFHISNNAEQPEFIWLLDRLRSGENFTNDDVAAFGEIFLQSNKPNLFIDDAKMIFPSLTKSLERKAAIKRIQNLSDPDKFFLYLFAVLRQYGNSNSEDKTISRIDLSEFVSLSYGEFTFACLGYFYGYSSLRNFDDRIFIKDEILSSNAKILKRLSIKFELTTFFDYTLIESVYQYCFNKIITDKPIGYLTSISIKSEPIHFVDNLPNEYKRKMVEILGKHVYNIKKIFPIENTINKTSKINSALINEIIEKLQKIENEIPAISDFGVFCYRNKLPLHIVNIMELIKKTKSIRYIVYFKKEVIIDKLKLNELDANEALGRLNSSILNNEFL